MKVTKIEVQKNNKNKVNIFCDEEYSFSLHTETLLKNHISVNTILTETQVENLVLEDNKLKALSLATNYVSKGLKSKKQIKDFLLKKEFSTVVINYVISKLEEYNLINDISYINAFIHDHNKYGQLKLKQMLLTKGFSKEKIEECFLDFETDLIQLQNLKDKYLKNKQNTYENNLKCKKYLLSHGFSFEDINKLDWSENEDWDW